IQCLFLRRFDKTNTLALHVAKRLVRKRSWITYRKFLSDHVQHIHQMETHCRRPAVHGVEITRQVPDMLFFNPYELKNKTNLTNSLHVCTQTSCLYCMLAVEEENVASDFMNTAAVNREEDGAAQINQELRNGSLGPTLPSNRCAVDDGATLYDYRFEP